MIKIYAITVFTILTLLTVSISLLKPEMTKPVQFAVNELQVTTSQVARNPNATNELPESIKIQAETNTKINVVEKIVENVSQKPKETVKNIEIKNINSIINEYKRNHKAYSDVRFPFCNGYRFDIDSPQLEKDIMYNPLKDALKEE